MAVAEVLEEYMQMGERIRAERMAQRKTLKRVADAAGISVPYLSDIEWGRRTPASTKLLAAIGKELAIDVQELLELAADDRSSFELDVPEGDELRREAAAVLARAWDDEAAIRAAIEAIRGRRKEIDE